MTSLSTMAKSAVGLAVVVALVTPAAARQAQFRYQPACEVLGLDPSRETVYCVTAEYLPGGYQPTGRLLVSYSSDAGRTWVPVAGNGLQGLGAGMPSQVLLSPEFEDDRTVYVQVVGGTLPGLYRSTDGGESFAVVGLRASTGYHFHALSAFLLPEEAPAAPEGGRDAFAYATPYDTPALVVPPAHQPVVGAPEPVEAFVLPSDFPDAPAVAIARGEYNEGTNPSGAVVQHSAYLCDATLACPRQIFEFPPGWMLVGARNVTDETTYVLLQEYGKLDNTQVWRRKNDTFVPWDSVNRLLPPADAGGTTDVRVAISASPGDESRYYMRITFSPRGGERGLPRADRIFRSVDAGESWRRIAFGRGTNQPGRAGNIPWTRRAGPPHAQGDLQVLPGNRLLVVAKRWHEDEERMEVGVFCSVDEGVTWTSPCPS